MPCLWCIVGNIDGVGELSAHGMKCTHGAQTNIMILFKGNVSEPGIFLLTIPHPRLFMPPPPASPNNRANCGFPAVAALSYNVGVVGNDPRFCNCATGLTCVKRTVLGDTTPGCPLRSTWGTALCEATLGVRARILDTKVARRARAGQTFPPSPQAMQCMYACPELNRGCTALNCTVHCMDNCIIITLIVALQGGRRHGRDA